VERLQAGRDGGPGRGAAGRGGSAAQTAAAAAGRAGAAGGWAHRGRLLGCLVCRRGVRGAIKGCTRPVTHHVAKAEVEAGGLGVQGWGGAGGVAMAGGRAAQEGGHPLWPLL
jgi:hypothetical protein